MALPGPAATPQTVTAALAALQEPPGWDRVGTEKIVRGADGQLLAGECAQLADAGATICVRGQICRKRVLANNLLFFSMREASSATSWVAGGARLQVTAKPPDGGDLGAPGLPPDQQAAARRFSHERPAFPVASCKSQTRISQQRVRRDALRTKHTTH